MIWTRSFWTAALERAIKATAWTLSSLLLADGTDILGTDWPARLSVAGMAGILSLLGSVASAGVGGTGPSLANEAIVEPVRDSDGGYTAIELLVGLVVLILVVLLMLELIQRL